QEAVEGVDVVLQRRAGGGHVQVLQDRAQQLGRGEGGVDDEGGGRARVQPGEEVAGQRRLARSDLAGDEDGPALLLAPELEVGEGLGVALRQVEVLGIGCEVERLLGESVEGLVHYLAPSASTKLRIRSRAPSRRIRNSTPSRGGLPSGTGSSRTTW